MALKINPLHSAVKCQEGVSQTTYKGAASPTEPKLYDLAINCKPPLALRKEAPNEHLYEDIQVNFHLNESTGSSGYATPSSLAGSAMNRLLSSW